MKRLFFLIALLLFAGALTSQNFKKGNVVGFHVMTFKLNENVTKDQMRDFLANEFAPAFNKIYKGDITLYIAKGERGDNNDGISIIYLIKSLKHRNKYFPTPGGSSKLNDENGDKLLPMFEKMDKLGTIISDDYTDWVVM
ncbi:MAG: hypothetical protein ACM3PX_11800 [Omnitrophica WOR_2 bacterium]|jgi:hypothetical protein